MTLIKYVACVVSLNLLAIGCSADPSSGGNAEQALALPISEVLTESGSGNEFVVTLRYGADVPEFEAWSMLRRLEIAPRADFFPDLAPEVLRALRGSRHVPDLLDADGIDVELESLDASVDATDYVWRLALTSAKAPASTTSAMGDIGSTSEALSLDVIVPPNKAFQSSTVTCTGALLTFKADHGSGSVCLENRDDGTTDCARTKAADLFPVVRSAVSFPFQEDFRARLSAGSSGMSGSGSLICG